MKNNKKLYAIIILITVIILSVISLLIIISNRKSIVDFEEYIYVDKVDKKFNFMAEFDGINIYSADGNFLGYSGIIYLNRTRYDSSFVSNSFKITLEETNDIEKLENEVNTIINKFTDYIGYKGNISHNLKSINGNEIDYSKSAIECVIDKDATLRYYIIDDNKIYYIDVYNENNNNYLEIIYSGE